MFMNLVINLGAEGICQMITDDLWGIGVKPNDDMLNICM